MRTPTQYQWTADPSCAEVRVTHGRFGDGGDLFRKAGTCHVLFGASKLIHLSPFLSCETGARHILFSASELINVLRDWCGNGCGGSENREENGELHVDMGE